MNMFYIIFIPFVLLCSGLMAFLMNKVRHDSTNSLISNITLLIVASIPYMYVIGKYSKNLVFDSMLFYIIWLAGFWIVMLLTPEGSKMNGIQIAGLIISIAGLVIVKVFG